MKFFKSLFGSGAAKFEDKGDELRLDFEYRDAAFRYQQGLDALDDSEVEASERIRKKMRDVRKNAFAQLLEEATDLTKNQDLELAQERLEIAANFADEEAAQAEVARRLEDLSEILVVEDPDPVETPETVATTEDDLFDLALVGYEPEERERAKALGEPFRLLYEACQKEEWKQAEEGLQDLLRDHPDEPLVLELAATASEELGDSTRALELLTRTRKLARDRAATVQALAGLYRKLDRHAEARNVLSEAVASRPLNSALPPSWIDIHMDHALALSEGGHHEEAVSSILSLVEVPAADQATLYFNLAGVLERMDRMGECRASLERAMDLAPRNPRYRERFSDLLVKQGQELDVALKLLVEANELETTGGGAGMLGGGASKASRSPNRGRYLYKMARIYFLKGEDLEADRTITTALAISRDSSVVGALKELRKELKELKDTRQNT